MVYWINAHRTWIEVADASLYREHVIARSDRTDYLVSRTLVLGIQAERRLCRRHRVEHSRTRFGQGVGHIAQAGQAVPSANQESRHVSHGSRCRSHHTVGHTRHCTFGAA